MWRWAVVGGLWAGGAEDWIPEVDDTASTTETSPVVAEVGPTLVPEEAYEASVFSVTWPEAETDEITWTWWVNGKPIGASGVELTGADFDRDDEVRVEGVPATGPYADTVGQSIAVTVLNTPPDSEAPTIQPEVLEVGMSAECVPGKATDEDGDEVTWDVRWWQNGQVSKTADLVLPESELMAGDELVCGLSPNDGTDVGAERLSEQRIVGVAQGYATELEAQAPMLWWPFDDVVPGSIEAWDANGVGVEPDSGAVYEGGMGITASPSLTATDGYLGFATTNSWFEFSDGIGVERLIEPPEYLNTEMGSLSFWFRTAEDLGYLYRGDAVDAHLFVRVYKGNVHLGIHPEPGTVPLPEIMLESALKYDDDVWHHVVATWDWPNQVAHLYLDGGDTRGGGVPEDRVLRASRQAHEARLRGGRCLG